MANIKQQKKRILQNERDRVRNRSVRSELKTRMRRVDEAVTAGDIETAEASAVDAQKAIGIAGRKGVLHKNTVARRQARVAHAVNKARAAQ